MEHFSKVYRILLIALAIALILAALLYAGDAHAQGGQMQISRHVSAEAFQQSDGLFHLVLSGDQVEIARICGYGDCASGFPNRLAALDYWRTLLNAAYGINIAPLPPPTG